MSTSSSATGASATRLPAHDSPQLERFTELMRVAAHPQRLAIVQQLGLQPMLTTAELCERTGLDRTAVSQHLITLRVRGVLLMHRQPDGKVRYALRVPLLGLLADILIRP